MKAVLIVYNAAIDSDVNEALESAGISCYTKATGVLGRGELSEPHLNIEVWPETNTAAFIVTDDLKARQIMELVRQMRQKLGSEGIKAFMWQIEDVT